MCALLVVIGTSCSSCNDPQDDNPQGDDNPVKSEKLLTQPADSLHELTGIAVGGAMNSIDLLVGDDTVTFNYPELDTEHRDSWEDGDKVQIRFVKTQEGDSVTDVNNISETA